MRLIMCFYVKHISNPYSMPFISVMCHTTNLSKIDPYFCVIPFTT